jgi:succinyl-diaminopimelate desuccinylase
VARFFYKETQKDIRNMTAQEIIEQTKQLVAIASTADSPRELGKAVDFVAEIIAKRCPNVTIERFVQNDKPSFLAYRGTRPEEFDILLNCHVDVVPASPELFKPIEKDGKLYGRGVLDMKGTALVLTDLFCELVNEVPYGLGLQVVSDEEVGGHSGVKHHLDRGVRTKFLVIGEYSNHRNTIYNAARGLCLAKIAFKGRASHGGHPWKGDNAVVKASAFAGEVLRRYPTPREETWTTTVNIAKLSTTNKTYSIVPDNATLMVDFRFTNEDPVFKNRDSLLAFIASVDPDAELVDASTFDPSISVDEANPYVQGLDMAMSKITGIKPCYLGRPGGSDGRHFAPFGSDVVEFGLCGQNSHSDGEYVELDSFEEYQNIMREFLKHPIPTELKQTAAKAPLHHKLLSDLVAMKTVTSDIATNNKALAYMEHFLEERGMFTKRYEKNGFSSLVATVKPDNKQPTVMLTGHIDVVPADKQQFTVQTKDGNYYGRGVYDMKFALASYLWLVDTLKDRLADYDFGLMITSDEEDGGVNGMGMLVDEGYLPKIAIVPDGGDNWHIQEFAKGGQWIKLLASGVPGHASQPWKADNAIHKLLTTLHEIQALVPEPLTKHDTLRTSLSIGVINGGETANQIAAEATSTLDIRYGNMADYERIYPAIQQICDRYGVKTELLVSNPPTENSPTDPYIKKFKDIIVAHLGFDPGPSDHFATTDARYLNLAGVPCVIVSPVGGDCHGEHEWLSIESYDQFCAILKKYIEDVAGKAI